MSHAPHINRILAILNSRTAAAWMKVHTGSMTKVDFQRVTVTELHRFPLPVALVSTRSRARLGLPSMRAWERDIGARLTTLVRQLCNRRAPPPDEDRARRLWDELERLVESMYIRSH